MQIDLQKLIEARRLLIMVMPYLETHHRMSRYGFGLAAKQLLEDIEEFLKSIGEE